MHLKTASALLAVAWLTLAAGRDAGAEGHVDLLSRGIPSALSDAANGASGIPAASRSVQSADGRWLVFTSTARDLLPGLLDRANTEDVFLLDRSTGTRSLISRRAGSAVITANAASTDPIISPDGRWIAFVSNAGDLVEGQVDPFVSSFDDRDVFLHDRLTGTTTLVSHVAGSPLTAAGRSSAPALSGDGNVVAYQFASFVYRFDRLSGDTMPVSRSAGSPAAARDGRSPSLSADGRFLLFVSRGQDLVAGQVDPAGEEDTFLYDHATGTTVLVSHAAGQPLHAGNGTVNPFERFVLAGAALSADGRWAAFTNLSSNLVPGQIDSATPFSDVFLWDRLTDTTILVSHEDASPLDATLGFLIQMSPDGSWVLFGRGFPDLADPAAMAPELALFRRDTGAVLLVNHAAGLPGTAGNGQVADATLSGDGRFVAFRSNATDLVAGAVDTNGEMDVFLYDRLSGDHTLVSHAAGSPGTASGSASATPRISEDGEIVAFASPGTDLATGISDLNGQNDVFLYTRSAGTVALASLRHPDVFQETPDGASSAEGLSADGRFVVFLSAATGLVPGLVDANGAATDVFLWDRDTAARTLVSRSAASATTTANGASGKPAISADGRWVTFQSAATDLVAGQVDPNGVDDVFLWDRTSGTLRLVSGSGGSATNAAGGLSEAPSISADGRWISFLSSAGDLLAGQATAVDGRDAFLWDRETGATVLVSRAGASTSQGAGASAAAVSTDGSSVGFLSTSTNVVPGQIDTAGTADVFLFHRDTGANELVSHASLSPTTAGNALSYDFALSSDGSRVAYTSNATDVVPGQLDENAASDLFLWTRSTGSILLVSRQAGTGATAADRYSASPSLSSDGRWVAFQSAARNLVAGQVDRNGWDSFSVPDDVFLFDATTGSMTLVSHQYGVSNATGSYPARLPQISADGRSVAFSSSAFDLLGTGSGAGGWNTFVFDRLAGRIRLASRSADLPLAPGSGDGSARAPRIGADGRYVAFTSLASNLVPGDFNEQADAFLFSDPPVARELFLVTPCRLFDTRRPEDGPALTSGVTRILELQGACGIPATAKALALNATVVEPSGAGYLTIYPADALPPLAATATFAAGQLRSNNALVSLAEDGSRTLALRTAVAGNGTVQVVLDVTGYFE
ncbi:MAG TPA: hypothetical protein DD490_01225 [Acidobacteria bacterium]|nr:hypothetical protein [Acidobacteriota bacterium]